MAYKASTSMSDDDPEDCSDDEEEEWDPPGVSCSQRLCWCLSCPVRAVASCFYSYKIKQWIHHRHEYVERKLLEILEFDGKGPEQSSLLRKLQGLDCEQLAKKAEDGGASPTMLESIRREKSKLIGVVYKQKASIAETTKKIMLSMSFLPKFVILNVYNTCQHHYQVEDDIHPPMEQSYFDDTNCHYIEELDVLVPKNDEQSSSWKGNLEREMGEDNDEHVPGKTGVPGGMFRKSHALGCIPIDDDIDPNCFFENIEGDEVGKTFSSDIIFACLHLLRIHGRVVAEQGSAKGKIFTEPASDQAQGEIAYFGIGQVLLQRSSRPDLGDHMVDLSHMSNLVVRPQFEKFGACAYFKYPGRQITSIYWSHEDRLVKPSDPLWNHAKWAWRCSLFLWVTAVDHLTYSHWIVSNALTTALRELPPDHPIRRVMHVATFGNAKVNSEAILALYPQNGIFHNGSALEWKGGLQKVFIDAGKTWKYKTFRDRCNDSELSSAARKEIPMYSCGLAIWECMHKFLSAYVKLYYPSEAALQEDEDLQTYWQFRCVPQYSNGLPPLSRSTLADQLADGLFGVSTYHQIVGDVLRYLRRADNMCWQIREDHDQADARALTFCLGIGCKTNRDMPEYDDYWFFGNWKRILIAESQKGLPRSQQACQLLDTFEHELKVLMKQINERERLNPGHGAIRPEFLACSVSL